jgi:hypothetical protein
MRESFERRYEAEHYLGREVRAGALIERLACLPGDVTEEAFLSELERLPYADLWASSNRVAELVGGQADGNADEGPLRPPRDRLLLVRSVSGPVLNEAAKTRADHVAQGDAMFVLGCETLDERCKSAFIAAFNRQGTDSDADVLAAAARDYEVIGSRAPLSGAQKWRAEAGRVMCQPSRTIAV